MTHVIKKKKKKEEEENYHERQSQTSFLAFGIQIYIVTSVPVVFEKIKRNFSY